MSLVSESVFYVGTVPITNSLLNTLVVDSFLIGTVYYLNKKIHSIPGKIQNLIEILIETFYNLSESIAGKKNSMIFPFFMSFFIFILASNWSGLIPGVGTIGFFENNKLIPFLRSSTSDINTTLGLALVSVVVTHIMSLSTLGLKEYLGRYFSLNPINLFVGVLEVISEITKVVSLSFRLFGNIFAGEVVLVTVSTIFAFVFPLPFMVLEIVVGLVQALVFSMLTMVFMSILTTSHHESQHKEVNNYDV